MVDQDVIKLCEDITNKIAEFQEYVDDNNLDNQTIILFFWFYRSWEVNPCCFVNWKKVTVEKFGDEECRLICPGSGIDSTNVSETSSPIIHKISGSVSICDFPGFEDTRGEKEEILHAYQNFKLLGKKNGKSLKIKIILVTSHAEMKYKRGTAINEMIDRIEKMFSSNSSIRNCINLAITQCRSLTWDGNGYDKDLLNKFKGANIFFFPQPKSEDAGKVYDTAKSRFDDLKSFIENNDGCLIDYKAKFNLDTKSESLLKETENMEVGKNTKKLQDIFDSFTSECNEGIEKENEITERIEYLKKQLKMVTVLKNIDDPLTFVSKLLSNAKSENLKRVLNEAKDQFKSIGTFSEFIETALGSEKIADKFNEEKNNRCDNLFNLLKVKAEGMIIQGNTEKLNDLFRSFEDECDTNMKNKVEITERINYLKEQIVTVNRLKGKTGDTFISELRSNANSEKLKKSCDQLKSINTFPEDIKTALSITDIEDKFNKEKNDEFVGLIDRLTGKLGGLIIQGNTEKLEHIFSSFKGQIGTDIGTKQGYTEKSGYLNEQIEFVNQLKGKSGDTLTSVSIFRDKFNSGNLKKSCDELNSINTFSIDIKTKLDISNIAVNFNKVKNVECDKLIDYLNHNCKAMIIDEIKASLRNEYSTKKTNDNDKFKDKKGINEKINIIEGLIKDFEGKKIKKAPEGLQKEYASKFIEIRNDEIDKIINWLNVELNNVKVSQGSNHIIETEKFKTWDKYFYRYNGNSNRYYYKLFAVFQWGDKYEYEHRYIRVCFKETWLVKYDTEKQCEVPGRVSGSEKTVVTSVSTGNVDIKIFDTIRHRIHLKVN